MHLILLSGGSGKRLWPLSNDFRSKQFLKLLQYDGGVRESMLQRVWRQLRDTSLEEYTIIATSRAQTEMIKNQIGPNVHLVVEPERRDTFPAIALAASYLADCMKQSEDEVVAILPVDPYVETSYFHKVRELESVLNQSGADLALMGVKPTYPSEKYGYIIPEEIDQNGYYKVHQFREKPNSTTAKQLLEKNAYWNCGVFAFRLKFILNILRSKGIEPNYEDLYNHYSSIPKNSFDYEVVEKANNIVMLPYDGYWKDLGTWNTLTDEMTEPLSGKGVISSDSENAHVINELDVPVAVLGLSNIVVAASPDGILVSHKDASPRVKEVIDFEQRPMYEERRWGWYKVLEYNKNPDGNEVLVKKVCLLEGKNLSYHHHNGRDEIWTIIRGEGMFIIEGQPSRVKQGDVIRIPAGTKHAILAEQEIEFIEVQQGNKVEDNDIIREMSSWLEIKTKFRI